MDAVASSDATNIQTSIRKEGNEIVINGHKWYVPTPFNVAISCAVLTLDWACRYISGAGDPRCKLHLVMGKSDPNNANTHAQQSIVIVPADAPGVKVVRPMKVFGYDDAPEGHCEVIYENVRVPASNIVAGWGRGFEVCINGVLRTSYRSLTSYVHFRSFKVVWGEVLRYHQSRVASNEAPGLPPDLDAFTTACDPSVLLSTL